MILVALILQAVSPVLAPIGRQELPTHGCAAYLWRTGEANDAPGVVAMAGADPALLRVMLDGKPHDLARTAQHGDAGFGLATSAEYRGPAVTGLLELNVATRADLSDGATVPQATLTLTRDGGEAIVAPLAGLIGCHR